MSTFGHALEMHDIAYCICLTVGETLLAPLSDSVARSRCLSQSFPGTFAFPKIFLYKKTAALQLRMFDFEVYAIHHHMASGSPLHAMWDFARSSLQFDVGFVY